MALTSDYYNDLQFYECTNTLINYRDYFFEYLNKALTVLQPQLEEHLVPTNLIYDLLMNGSVAFFRDGGKVWFSRGTLSGVFKRDGTYPNYLVANPAFPGISNLTIGEDCEVVYLTPLQKKILNSSFYSLLRRTAGIMADNLTSLNCLQINSRASVLVSADTPAALTSAEEALRDKYRGKPYRVAQSNLVSTITTDPLTTGTTSTTIKDLLDLNNYMDAQFMHSIGISSLEVQKPEHILTAESTDDYEACKLNIDIMKDSIEEGLLNVNKMFGTNYHILTPYEPEKPEPQKEPTDDSNRTDD